MRKALRLARSYLRQEPLWCSWQVTRRCDSLCQFCEHRLEGEFEAGLDTCRRIVSQLDRLGSLVVSLTGGDPFLRADLAEIVSSLSREHVVRVSTHGWPVTRPKARAVWEAGLWSASALLADADPSRHDEIVGFEGAHARALSAVRTLCEERQAPSQQVGLKVRLGSLEGLEELLGWASKLGVQVSVEPAFPVGREPRQISRDLLRMKARYPCFSSATGYLEKFDRAFAEGVPGCRAGSAFLNIDHRGRVSKCIEFQGGDEVLGDLSSEEIEEILPRLRQASEANECRSCWHSSRGEVEGLYSLRGLARALPVAVRA